MKVVDKIDDSYEEAERIVYVVELEPDIFADVMVINDDIHSKDYMYIMDFDGGQAYIETDDGDKGIDYPFDKNEVLAFVQNTITKEKKNLNKNFSKGSFVYEK